MDHFDATVQGEEIYGEHSLAILCPDCGTDHKSLSDEINCPGFADSLSLVEDGDDFQCVTLGGYTADYDNPF